MAKLVCNGAVLQCTFGAAPGTLVVTPDNRVTASNLPAATIMDHLPTKNVTPFGMCSAPTNPAVISATAAAMGTPTPAPCVPATAAPWLIGSPRVMIGNKIALNDTSTLLCTWLGTITIKAPGQATVDVP